MIKFQWSKCCTVLFPFSHEPSEHDAWAQMPRSGKRIRDSRFISQLGVGVTGWTWSSRQTECSQNKHCEVSRKNVLLFWLKDKKTEQEKGASDVRLVMNFLPLVITTLEFPYHGATAPLACVPGRRATYPDRRRLVLHSFCEQGPLIS